MAHKNHYRKIFVIAAALFVLLAPVGMTMRGGASGLMATPISNLASSRYSSFHLAFNLNLAEASGSAPAASTPSPVDWLTSPVTSAVYYVSLTIDKIMTLAVVAGAFLVRLGLQFNDNIFNSPEVQTGFSVSLAIANLGFVLGIIVIAIATIIRNQTYGIKQLLWKLVFMAILVNFGLVIMAPIVGFADSMSSYFINATSPSSATGGYEGYVTTMAQAFAPQTMTPANSVTPSPSCSGAAAGTGIAAICNLQTIVGTATQAGSPDSLTQQILSMVFGIVFLAMTAFTFFCLAILLVIRYLMLAGLLIVLPLAWLTYVFPKFDNSFSKWWNTFVKWTLFPPVALFFIYLAFTTAANTGGLATQNAYLKQAAGLPQGAQQGPEGALVYQTGLSGAIQQSADEILLVGLTIMGLMFALSLSGKAGSTVVNGATAASKAVGGYVGKKGKRLVGDRLRTVGQKYNPETKETTSALQRFGSRLQGIPVVGALGGRAAGSALANYTAPKAVGAERKAEIEEYTKKNLDNIDSKGILALANSKTATLDPTKAAALAQVLAKRDLLSKLDEKTQKKYLGYAESMGTAEEVYGNRPDLMEPREKKDPITGATTMETKEEAVTRAVKATKGDVTNISAQVFNMMNPSAARTVLGTHMSADISKEAVLALSPTQLGKLGEDPGSAERKKYVTEAIQNLAHGYRKEIEKETNIDPATGLPEKDTAGNLTGRQFKVGTGKYELDTAAITAAIAANPALKNLESLPGLVKHMEHSSNWVSAIN